MIYKIKECVCQEPSMIYKIKECVCHEPNPSLKCDILRLINEYINSDVIVNNYTCLSGYAYITVKGEPYL